MESRRIDTGRRWKAATVALATLLVVIAVAQRLEAPRDALAQVPDAGLQRQQMIKELETANRKLTEVAALLKEIRDQRVEKPKRSEPPREP
jgi:hypothetical protein